MLLILLLIINLLFVQSLNEWHIKCHLDKCQFSIIIPFKIIIVNYAEEIISCEKIQLKVW